MCERTTSKITFYILRLGKNEDTCILYSLSVAFEVLVCKGFFPI